MPGARRWLAGCAIALFLAPALPAGAPAAVGRGCFVPYLKGDTLRAAKSLLTNHHCTLGKVTHAASSTVKRGRIISQSPRAGTVRGRNARVSVVVSNGKH